jgi:hypothetical protein
MVFTEVLMPVQDHARVNQCFRGLLGLTPGADVSAMPAGKFSHDDVCVRVFGNRVA